LLDFLLPIWNPFIVHPLMEGLRAITGPLEPVVGPGMAGGLAIIIFTIVLRLLLVPLSLIQIRSQRAQMAIQPELKVLQKKYKGDREGMARAQMALYRERGVNPAAGCLPLLLQLPILFGMYSAMSNLSTLGLTLDQVITSQIESGRVVYEATRREEPIPLTQFVLATLEVVPRTAGQLTIELPEDQADVTLRGVSAMQRPGVTQGLTLTTGSTASHPNPPNTPTGKATMFLRPGGVRNPDGTLDRNVVVAVGQPYLVEVVVYPNQAHVDGARAVVTYDPAVLETRRVETPRLEDLPFKSRFLWLPSLGEPDLIHLFGLGIPGLLLIVMTITSFVSQRMTTLPTDDPQQQAMMRSMAFMPLMYLFFFLTTPAGLVLYWLISNVFSMFQQYFTVGMGMLAGDLMRFTGRDFQPSWAHLPGPSQPANNGTADGTVEPSRDSDVTTTGVSKRGVHQTRRTRANPGKGRKRGKR
jgi:YidC/Oxa1 family membrane protein insertase